jgi:hypothetical protein
MGVVQAIGSLQGQFHLSLSTEALGDFLQIQELLNEVQVYTSPDQCLVFLEVM